MLYSKEDFIRLALHYQVLKFGEFTLKSGRVSPYFFNAGLFYHGEALHKLGKFYANVLLENHVKFDHLFGPAYKGLPLATATSIALAEFGKPSTVTFNRKEMKTHGEGGQLIGSPLHGRTIIIDDVITAGTAFREAQSLINANGGKLTGVVIALDRCERGISNESAIAEIKQQGIEVYSIITLFDLIEYLRANKLNQEVDKLMTYQEKYGV
ncbi:orotate phosphoribosyltransferase [Legionella israelensis]|uniref:Orotate phosphoribosyltransferase n=1 Tax=Legionella israelensis TaxID=454 RepID=A0A0W0VU23_9GAMM|nr:orotate phosphoribosyltransferase [Legionella israelensis]KTD23680.1 orotate phosphoribosyltransferase [Legionella israelensis]QBS10937.1 orotate phosphoribosyltransferase [Legionella israelensis]SCX79620.1 orotate phosphoribosyltransferase [Legionella israelensis DSM 19235]STX57928.1 orotate phosphoribosyltransferase [Legionella israelensis]